MKSKLKLWKFADLAILLRVLLHLRPIHLYPSEELRNEGVTSSVHFSAVQPSPKSLRKILTVKCKKSCISKTNQIRGTKKSTGDKPTTSNPLAWNREKDLQPYYTTKYKTLDKFSRKSSTTFPFIVIYFNLFYNHSSGLKKEVWKPCVVVCENESLSTRTSYLWRTLRSSCIANQDASISPSIVGSHVIYS